MITKNCRGYVDWWQGDHFEINKENYEVGDGRIQYRQKHPVGEDTELLPHHNYLGVHWYNRLDLANAQYKEGHQNYQLSSAQVCLESTENY